MQAVLDIPTARIATLSQAEIHHAASIYVTTHVNPAFEVVEGKRFHHKTLGREVWQFIIRCAQGALGTLEIDAQTGAIMPLTGDEIRILREKAAIVEAQASGVLPVDEHNHVLAEYARRKANGYLSKEISLFCSATDGVFIPLTCPIWQFAIRFGLPRLGELGILGTLDVDARTGEPIPLITEQIERMRVRADAIVEFHTPTAAA